mmetsp:Transcript_2534/g.5428  ORF Transcript_2534/g.5428 Transcript_2534/m.5428 type:complete len:87 (-) Transcript_2534:481-741(-)
MGTEVAFTQEDYQFSKVQANAVSHIYGRCTTDLALFEGILRAFHANRDAYCDEVISACGLPIWLEGPESSDPEECGWGNNIWVPNT